jgi:hypothetical protein
MYQGDTVEVAERVKQYWAHDFPPGSRVWGFGCAEGFDELYIAKKFPVGFVTGFDIDPKAIEQAKQKSRDEGVYDKTRFICMDVNQLFFAWRPFLGRLDVLLAHSVARWIGPKELGDHVGLFKPSVIYYVSHGENDYWTMEFGGHRDVQSIYRVEELTRLPYTVADPRLLRVMYRMERTA